MKDEGTHPGAVDDQGFAKKEKISEFMRVSLEPRLCYKSKFLLFFMPHLFDHLLTPSFYLGASLRGPEPQVGNHC